MEPLTLTLVCNCIWILLSLSVTDERGKVIHCLNSDRLLVIKLQVHLTRPRRARQMNLR